MSIIKVNWIIFIFTILDLVIKLIIKCIYLFTKIKVGLIKILIFLLTKLIIIVFRTWPRKKIPSDMIPEIKSPTIGKIFVCLILKIRKIIIGVVNVLKFTYISLYIKMYFYYIPNNLLKFRAHCNLNLM